MSVLAYCCGGHGEWDQVYSCSFRFAESTVDAVKEIRAEHLRAETADAPTTTNSVRILEPPFEVHLWNPGCPCQAVDYTLRLRSDHADKKIGILQMARFWAFQARAQSEKRIAVVAYRYGHGRWVQIVSKLPKPVCAVCASLQPQCAPEKVLSKSGPDLSSSPMSTEAAAGWSACSGSPIACLQA